MRIDRLLLPGVCGLLLGVLPGGAQAPVVPLVLEGGTLVDVTDWGRSAKDQPDSIVIVQNGRITDVGSRATLPIPKGARVIDCTGKYIVPGLVDGFAGMSSQAEANADLYMGVTTVVASSDSRRGHIDFTASPTPHLYLVDSIGTTDDWSLLIGQPVWANKLRESSRPALTANLSRHPTAWESKQALMR